MPNISFILFSILVELGVHILLCMCSSQPCLWWLSVHRGSIVLNCPLTLTCTFPIFWPAFELSALSFPQLTTAIHLFLLLLLKITPTPPTPQKTNLLTNRTLLLKTLPHSPSPPLLASRHIVPDGVGGRESSLGTPREEWEDWESKS